ncbi:MULTISPECIES: glycosyl hydrolase family 18 protein [unclassified Sedimentibacter]|uniref:glycosyl hydrolase family 18 protein n=1 Tax=unclassified Sedimentibacter TaxID=2649220 RepID=UPI0027DF0E62|nr:glycosyl hydrolase family 18 protein [Sedimentibacter sp. MB35-C1]WMJ77412.1 glycosyl hydrolase family 18 protein [Sedimentibacter sp. MB35-C1]
MKKYLKINNIAVLLLIVILLGYRVDNTVFADKNLKAPESPVNLTVKEVTESSVTLEWDKPQSSNINNYKIYKNSTYIDSTKTNTYKVENLNPDTEYEFYIRSETANNNVSPAGEPIVVKTDTSVESAKIIGYYPAWKSYDEFTPDNIDAQKLTHINYAFAYIGQDNKIKLGYPDKDPENFEKLNELKGINPDLKILISVGGWNWSAKFSDVASSDSSREIFAQSCVDFIVKYGIDGIDLDWEYPVGGGLEGNSNRPEDKQNFTLLLKEIREKLDEQGVKDNKHYLLTIACGASSYYLENIEASKINEYVDYANLMTYDLHGPWDSYSDFNAPLYSSSAWSPQYKASVDSSVELWINAGFTKDKIVVGVPFYGYLYNVETHDSSGLYQVSNGGEALSYSTIMLNYLNGSYNKMYSEESMVPWIYKDNIFISYDDAESIALKSEYVKDKGLAGVMIWELSQDYNSELLNSVFNALN